MRKVVITGASGMLGSDLVRTFQKDGNYDIYAIGRAYSPLLPTAKQMRVDFSEAICRDALSLEADVILHTAAITNLSICEQNPALAHQVHVEATQWLSKSVKKQGKVFYFSTDSIFDGLKGGYREQDVPNPSNVYAFTKLNGEKRLQQQEDVKSSIIRTNIYGFNVPLRSSLVEWALQEWSKGNKISGFTDVVFNAVYTEQLAEIVKIIVDEDMTVPILNIGSKTYLTKYSFLDRLRSEFGFGEWLLTPALSSDFKSAIQRPKNTTLDTEVLSNLCRVPDFEEGIERLKQNFISRAQDVN